MRIGQLTASLSRRGGGVFDACCQLAHRLAAQPGCEVEVFGLEDDDTQNDRTAWRDLPVHALPVIGPAAFGFSLRLGRRLHDAQLDLLHAHGLWMYPSRAAMDWARRTGRPHVVSPHGMLDGWALRRSRGRKRVVGRLFEDRHLHNADCLHALSEAEHASMRDYGLRNPVCVIPNGVAQPSAGTGGPPDWHARLPHGARVLLYLGRIHPKKGLANLLHAFASAADPAAADTDWQLVIAGWDQGGHEAELQRLASRSGIASRIHFVGAQYGADKTASFQHADAFILPSYSEGLPVVVLEAWSHRLPVLMTPQCNLPEGFAAEAAIRVLPEQDALRDGLRALFGLDDADRRRIGERGERLVRERFSWDHSGEAVYAVYRWLLQQGAMPDCVLMD